MNKFEVGDRVRVVRLNYAHILYKDEVIKFLGGVYNIIYVFEDKTVGIDVPSNYNVYPSDWLELVEKAKKEELPKGTDKVTEKITYKMLREKGCCDEGLDAFVEEFGKEGGFAKVRDRITSSDKVPEREKYDWLDWFNYKFPTQIAKKEIQEGEECGVLDLNEGDVFIVLDTGEMGVSFEVGDVCIFNKIVGESFNTTRIYPKDGCDGGRIEYYKVRLLKKGSK